MLGKVIGAALGEHIGRRYGSGAKGALNGTLAPAIARRLLAPAAIVIAGGYAVKKLYDYRRASAEG